MEKLLLPNIQRYIYPGDIVKLRGFDDEWKVRHGWYHITKYAGPAKGWYIISKNDLKSLDTRKILDDICLINP